MMYGQFGWGTLEEGWRKGPWTAQEDKRLSEYVRLHGEGRWNSVSKLIGLKRSGKSCRLRWVNYLRPDLKRGKITPHEESIIIQLHARWGNRWSMIAQSLPGRTDNEIKNYWRTHFKKAKSLKKLDRTRAARLLRQQLEQQQQQQQQQQHYEKPEEQVPPQHQVDVRKMILQLEDDNEFRLGLLAQDMQEMALMNPMPYMLHGETSDEAAAAAAAAASEDGTWGSLWNLDGANAAACGADMSSQDQLTTDSFYMGEFK